MNPYQLASWRRCLLLFIFLGVLCAGGCGDDSLKPGVVASVNGEAITLQSLQALLDSRSAALGLQAGMSLEEMREDYGRALNTLIAGALVRQELRERGIAASERDLDLAIERISSDYGEDGLEKFLSDAMLRLEDWRELMRDHLALEIFRNQILLPGIKIDFQEVKNYYQEHKNDFLLPETARTCFLSSGEKDILNEWCRDVSSHNFLEDGVAQCVEVRLDEVPQPWKKELKALKPMSCGKIRQEDGEWQSVALLERQPERVPELSEVYPLVEKILLEPKQAAAFDSWLEQKILKSRVLVAPDLIGGMNASGHGEKLRGRPAPGWGALQ